MKRYEKLETVFCRDTEGDKKLMWGVYRNPTVEYLKDNEWVWTEKVDGTNIGIVWDGHSVSFQGRTERAQIPSHLQNKLESLFGSDEAEELFEQMFGEKEVILFGEGYGNKIGGVGNKYIKDDVSFILFDVLIGENYQERENVERIAKAFGIEAVPICGRGTLNEAINFVMRHPMSNLAALPMEGVVCRPTQELRDRCGNRVIVKVKWRDFEPFAFMKGKHQ